MRTPGPAASPGPGGLRSAAEQLRLRGRELFVGEHALVVQVPKLAQLIHHRWLSRRRRGRGRGLLRRRIAAVTPLLLGVALLLVATLLLVALLRVAVPALLLLLQAGQPRVLLRLLILLFSLLVCHVPAGRVSPAANHRCTQQRTPSPNHVCLLCWGYAPSTRRRRRGAPARGQP